VSGFVSLIVALYNLSITNINYHYTVGRSLYQTLDKKIQITVDTNMTRNTILPFFGTIYELTNKRTMEETMKRSLSLLVLVAIFLIAFTTPIMANEGKKISVYEFTQKTGIPIEDIIGDGGSDVTTLDCEIIEDAIAFYIYANGELLVIVK